MTNQFVYLQVPAMDQPECSLSPCHILDICLLFSHTHEVLSGTTGVLNLFKVLATLDIFTHNIAIKRLKNTLRSLDNFLEH